MKKARTSKRKNLAILFLATTLILAIASGSFLFFTKNRNNDILVAKINDEKIFRTELNSKIREIFLVNNDEANIPEIESLPSQIIETFAKEIYLERELVKLAKKHGLEQDINTKQQIENSISRILTNAYINFKINQEVSDEKIRNKYAELNNDIEGGKEFLISHIVVKNKDSAEKIYKELFKKKPAKFSDLAKKYSIDKDSSNKGGSLGYVLDKNIDKEISASIANLKKGEISKPINTKFGWHIIKLEDSRESKALVEFESLKNNIREQMLKDVTSAIYNDIFKDVKVKIIIDQKKNNINEQKTSPEEAK